jgi:hypothetical protein
LHRRLVQEWLGAPENLLGLRVVTVPSAPSSLAGYAFFDGASNATIAFALGFALAFFITTLE